MTSSSRLVFKVLGIGYLGGFLSLSLYLFLSFFFPPPFVKKGANELIVKEYLEAEFS